MFSLKSLQIWGEFILWYSYLFEGNKLILAIHNCFCILSLSQAFFKYIIKNIWLPPGIESRTSCLMHMCSATELRQPASKQTPQFCIYAVKGYCYATVKLSTDQRKFSLFFSKDSFYLWIFLLIYHFTISFSSFFYSL